LETLINKFGLIELDHRRYDHAFEGVTRADVELMLRYKVEREDMEKRLAELATNFTSFRSKVIDGESQK
jgi:hypothetical protein